MRFFALGSPIRFEYTELFQIPFYDFPPFQNLAGIFRASGRFGWPLFYLLNIFILLMIIKNLKTSAATIILILALFLQIADLTPKYNAVYAQNNENAPQIFISEEWESAIQNKKQLIMMTNSMPQQLENGALKPNWHFYAFAAFYPAYLAQKHKIPTNYAHSNRSDFQKIHEFNQKQWTLLKTAHPEKHTLYVFLPDITQDDLNAIHNSLKPQLIHQTGFTLLPIDDFPR